jgi:cytochrome c oxidase assembly protein subunit 15
MGVLVFVLFVIAWGALVRATGSGAGCGNHWPMCNGEVLPRAPGQATIIELFHRVTSALSALSVLLQMLWARRLYASGHRVRRATYWSAVFMLGEVAIGAALVLFHLVGDDSSVTRAVVMGIHLINTFLLVGSATLVVHFSGGGLGFSLRRQGLLGWLAGACIACMLLLGASGAVAALGDTLFPPESLGTALADDLSLTAHVLVRLRIVHPFLAVGVAFLLLFTRFAYANQRGTYPGVRGWGLSLRLLVMGQLVLGLVNTLLLAPIWLQLAHLVVADALWIALVMMVAHGLRPEPALADEEVVAPPAAVQA